MGLFNKKDERPGSSWLDDDAPEPQQVCQVNYNSVTNWLIGLSQEDLDKVNKVVNIYRKANKEAAKSLGMEFEPTSFINPPEEEPETVPPVVINKKEKGSFLDDDTDIEDLLEDIEPEFADENVKTSKASVSFNDKKSKAKKK